MSKETSPDVSDGCGSVRLLLPPATWAGVGRRSALDPHSSGSVASGGVGIS